MLKLQVSQPEGTLKLDCKLAECKVYRSRFSFPTLAILHATWGSPLSGTLNTRLRMIVGTPRGTII